MQRRDFLAAAGLTAAGLLATRRMADGALPIPKQLDRIGLELYAVRKAMRADPARTLQAIRDIGYTDVELLWSFKNFGQSVREVRDTLKATGLKAPSAHMAPDTILTEWDTRLDEARQLGHQLLVVPSLPSEANSSIDAWKVWAHRFNVAGEVARRAGIWLTFHNEPNHQKPIQGEMPLEVFARETDPKVVKLQLDVGNMLMGGGDPMAFLSRYQDRCASFHIKNVVPDRSRDTELPKGTFDVRAFLAAIPNVSKTPCFVEQEGSADEMASARENFTYLQGLRW